MLTMLADLYNTLSEVIFGATSEALVSREFGSAVSSSLASGVGSIRGETLSFQDTSLHQRVSDQELLASATQLSWLPEDALRVDSDSAHSLDSYFFAAAGAAAATAINPAFGAVIAVAQLMDVVGAVSVEAAHPEIQNIESNLNVNTISPEVVDVTDRLPVRDVTTEHRERQLEEALVSKITFPVPNKGWALGVGGSADDQGVSGVPMPDGGAMVAAITGSFGAGGYDMLFHRVDAGGRKVCSITVGGSGIENINQMVLASANEFFFVGNTQSFGAKNNDVLVGKVDGSCNLGWLERVGGNGNDYGESIAVTSTKLILGGTTDSWGAGDRDAFIAILNRNTGQVDCFKAAGGPSVEFGHHVAVVDEGLPNERYRETGFTGSFGVGGGDGFVMEWGPTCNLLNARTYGAYSSDDGLKTATLSDGGFCFLGYSASYSGAYYSMQVSRVTPLGAIKRTIMLRGNGEVFGKDIVALPDGGCGVTGSTAASSVGQTDEIDVRFDSEGRFVSAAIIGAEGGEVGRSVAFFNNTRFVVGSTSSFGAGGNDIFLMKSIGYDSPSRLSGMMNFGTFTGTVEDMTGKVIVLNLNPTITTVTPTVTPILAVANPVQPVVTPLTGDFDPEKFAIVSDAALMYKWSYQLPASPYRDLSLTPTFLVDFGGANWLTYDTTSREISGTLLSVSSTSSELITVTPQIVVGTTTMKFDFFTIRIRIVPTDSFVSKGFLSVGALPMVTNVALNQPYSFNVSQALAPGVNIRSIVEWKKTTLPNWLNYHSNTRMLEGEATGAVRGFYYLNMNLERGLDVQDITFVLNVTNTAPYLTVSSMSTKIGSLQIPIAGSVKDQEGDAISSYGFSKYNGNPISSIATIAPTTGVISVVTTSGKQGDYFFNVTMSDSFGAVGWGVLRLRVENTPPVFQYVFRNPGLITVGDQFKYSFPENAATDPDGDFVDYSSSGPVGSAFDPGSRELTWSPSQRGFFQAYFFATDQYGGVSNRSITVEVNGLPVQQFELTSLITTLVDQFYNQTLHGWFKDPEDPVSYQLIEDGQHVKPSWLTFMNGPGVLSGTPDRNTHQPSALRVMITDGRGAVLFRDIELSVPNSSPYVAVVPSDIHMKVRDRLAMTMLSNTFGDVDRDNLILLLASCNEQEKNLLSFAVLLEKALIITPGQGTELAPGEFYCAAVTADDQQGGKETVRIRVFVENEPPEEKESLPESVTVIAGETQTIKVGRSVVIDPEGGELTKTWYSDSAVVLFDTEKMELKIAPGLTDFGTFRFALNHTDPKGASVIQKTRILLDGLPRPNPEFSQVLSRVIPTAAVGEYFEWRIQEKDFENPEGDIDAGGPVQYVLAFGMAEVLAARGIRYDSLMRTFSGIILAGPNIHDPLVISMSAVDQNKGPTAFSLTFQTPNSAPIKGTWKGTLSGNVGQLALLTISSTDYKDLEGDAVTFTLLRSNGQAVPSFISLQGNVIKMEAPAGTQGHYDGLFVRVTDTGGKTLDLSLTVTVQNRAPVLNTASLPAPVFLSQGETAQLALGPTIQDVADGEPVTLSVATGAGFIRYQESDKTLVIAPTSNDQGIFMFTTRGVDPWGAMVSFNTTVTVNGVPYLTRVLPVIETSPVGQVFRFPLLDLVRDPEGKPITYSLDPDVSHLTPSWLTLEGNTLSGIPTENAHKVFSIRVKATDEKGSSTWFVLGLETPNSAPLQNPAVLDPVVEANVGKMKLVVFPKIITQDPDGDEVIFELDSVDSKIENSVFLTGNAISVLPEQGTQGEYLMSLLGKDADGAVSSPRTVTLRVLNRAPVVKNLPGVVKLSAGEVATIDLSNVAPDADQDPTTVRLVGTSSFVALDEKGKATFSPTQEDMGMQSISFETADPHQGKVQFAVSVAVNGLPELNPDLDPAVRDFWTHPIHTPVVGQPFALPIPENLYRNSPRDIDPGVPVQYLLAPGMAEILNARGIQYDLATRKFSSPAIVADSKIHDPLVISMMAVDQNKGPTAFSLTFQTPNTAPKSVATLPDVNIQVGDPSQVVDLTPVFADSERDSWKLLLDPCNEKSISKVASILVGGTALNLAPLAGAELVPGDFYCAEIKAQDALGAVSEPIQMRIFVENQAPEIREVLDGVLTVIAGQTQDYLVSRSSVVDPEGRALTTTFISSSPFASWNDKKWVIHVAPDLNAFGTYNMTLSWRDPLGASVSHTLKLLIDGVPIQNPDLAPEIQQRFNAPIVTAPVGKVFSMTLPEKYCRNRPGDTDENVPVTYELTPDLQHPLPEGLSFNSQTRTLAGVFKKNDHQPFKLLFKVSNQKPSQSQAQTQTESAVSYFELEFTIPNSAPTLVKPLEAPQVVTVGQMQTYPGSLSKVRDIDGDTVRCELSPALPFMTLNTDDCSILLAPTDTQFGFYNVTLRFRDDLDASLAQTLTFPVNGLPELNPDLDPAVRDFWTHPIHTPVVGQPFALPIPENLYRNSPRDIDPGVPVQYLLAPGMAEILNARGIQYDFATRKFSSPAIVADSKIHDPLVISMMAVDQNKGPTSFSLTFQTPNSAPTVGIGFADQVIQVNQVSNIPISADAFIDLDQDTLTYTLQSRSGIFPRWASLTNGVLNFSPRPGDQGHYEFELSARDVSGKEASLIFTVEVPNNAPEITYMPDAPLASAGEFWSMPFSSQAFVVDENGDKISLAVRQQNGTWQVNYNAVSQTLSGKPPRGSPPGVTALEINVSDGVLKNSVRGYLYIHLENSAPQPRNDIPNQQVNQATPVLEFKVTEFDDANGDGVSYAAGMQGDQGVKPLPDWVQFDVETRAFVVNPAAVPPGDYPLVVTATDSRGKSTSVNFNLAVQAAPPAPKEDLAGKAAQYATPTAIGAGLVGLATVVLFFRERTKKQATSHITTLATEICKDYEKLPLQQRTGRIMAWLDKNDPLPPDNKEMPPPMRQNPSDMTFRHVSMALKQFTVGIHDRDLENGEYPLRKLKGALDTFREMAKYYYLREGRKAQSITVLLDIGTCNALIEYIRLEMFEEDKSLREPKIAYGIAQFLRSFLKLILLEHTGRGRKVFPGWKADLYNALEDLINRAPRGSPIDLRLLFELKASQAILRCMRDSSTLRHTVLSIVLNTLSPGELVRNIRSLWREIPDAWCLSLLEIEHLSKIAILPGNSALDALGKLQRIAAENQRPWLQFAMTAILRDIVVDAEVEGVKDQAFRGEVKHCGLSLVRMGFDSLQKRTPYFIASDAHEEAKQIVTELIAKEKKQTLSPGERIMLGLSRGERLFTNPVPFSSQSQKTGGLARTPSESRMSWMVPPAPMNVNPLYKGKSPTPGLISPPSNRPEAIHAPAYDGGFDEDSKTSTDPSPKSGDGSQTSDSLPGSPVATRSQRPLLASVGSPSKPPKAASRRRRCCCPWFSGQSSSPVAAAVASNPQAIPSTWTSSPLQSARKLPGSARSPMSPVLSPGDASHV